MAFGQWKRQVKMVHANWIDSPPARTLSYFRTDPCSRSDRTDRILQCSLNPSATELEQRLKTRTKFRVVGRVGAFYVYDLEYYFDGEDPGQPGVRSVLIGKTRQELHEIHVQDRQPLGTLYATQILHIGRQPILMIKADDGGMYHQIDEDYFAVSQAGASLLDFKPVFEAADHAIPSDMVTYQPTSTYDFEASVFRVRTEKRDVNIGRKVACCEGSVEVPFRIEQGRVVPGKAEYIPPDNGR